MSGVVYIYYEKHVSRCGECRQPMWFVWKYEIGNIGINGHDKRGKIVIGKQECGCGREVMNAPSTSFKIHFWRRIPDDGMLLSYDEAVEV